MSGATQECVRGRLARRLSGGAGWACGRDSGAEARGDGRGGREESEGETEGGRGAQEEEERGWEFGRVREAGQVMGCIARDIHEWGWLLRLRRPLFRDA